MRSSSSRRTALSPGLRTAVFRVPTSIGLWKTRPSGEIATTGVDAVDQNGMDVRGHIHAERDELVALLRTLGPDQWSTQSLCGLWSVRDVATHLSMDSVTMPRYFLAALRNRSADRVNESYVATHGDVATDALVEQLADSAASSWFARYAPRLTLADHVVHQQDIRRPLGLPRTIDPERLCLVLDRPDPFARPRRFTRGLRFAATDLAWASGSGPEVRGQAEALALVMVGRPSVLDELEGDGVGLLRARMSPGHDSASGR